MYLCAIHHEFRLHYFLYRNVTLLINESR
uniref:Uncharacterized protein n=1 Tax=Arundo donax TaxID=35708 RepID=A0A0A9EG32_ARUDO